MIDKNSIFIGLTETWLNQAHGNAEPCPDGYELIRQDREGGGVAILLQEELTAEPLLSYSNDGCEILIVKILQLNHVCCVIYRPPGTPYVRFRDIRCSM